jgi:hypothetical protein
LAHDAGLQGPEPLAVVVVGVNAAVEGVVKTTLIQALQMTEMTKSSAMV